MSEGFDRSNYSKQPDGTFAWSRPDAKFSVDNFILPATATVYLQPSEPGWGGVTQGVTQFVHQNPPVVSERRRVNGSFYQPMETVKVLNVLGIPAQIKESGVYWPANLAEILAFAEEIGYKVEPDVWKCLGQATMTFV